jgi:hypothetical protein
VFFKNKLQKKRKISKPLADLLALFFTAPSTCLIVRGGIRNSIKKLSKWKKS